MEPEGIVRGVSRLAEHVSSATDTHAIVVRIVGNGVLYAVRAEDVSRSRISY
jgi:hypothetical protein